MTLKEKVAGESNSRLVGEVIRRYFYVLVDHVTMARLSDRHACRGWGMEMVCGIKPDEPFQPQSSLMRSSSGFAPGEAHGMPDDIKVYVTEVAEYHDWPQVVSGNDMPEIRVHRAPVQTVMAGSFFFFKSICVLCWSTGRLYVGQFIVRYGGPVPPPLLRLCKCPDVGLTPIGPPFPPAVLDALVVLSRSGIVNGAVREGI